MRVVTCAGQPLTCDPYSCDFAPCTGKIRATYPTDNSSHTWSWSPCYFSVAGCTVDQQRVTFTDKNGLKQVYLVGVNALWDTLDLAATEAANLSQGIFQMSPSAHEFSATQALLEA